MHQLQNRKNLKIFLKKNQKSQKNKKKKENFPVNFPHLNLINSWKENFLNFFGDIIILVKVVYFLLFTILINQLDTIVFVSRIF